MTSRARFTISVMCALLVATSGGAATILTIDHEMADRAGAATTVDARVATAASAVQATEEKASAAAQQKQNLQSAAAERARFDEAIAAATEALLAATGKVDPSEPRQVILNAQQRVIHGWSSATEIATAYDEVVAATADLNTRLAAYQDERETPPPRPSPSSRPTVPPPSSNSSQPATGTEASWFDRARATLDAVGGAGVPLVQGVDGCNGVSSTLCTTADGTIYVGEPFAAWTPARQGWGMVHELAHTRQFLIWEELLAAPTYRDMFASDIELLANCMATARGYSNHGHRCSSEQVAWAAGVWDGRV